MAGNQLDNPQRILLGRSGQHGTGAIPKDAVANFIPAGGVPQLVDSIEVRQVGGTTSRIGFKSYEQGREKWQSETLDWVWFDEEPPLDIYTALQPPAIACVEAVRRSL
jgi:hypothetical protein